MSSRLLFISSDLGGFLRDDDGFAYCMLTHQVSLGHDSNSLAIGSPPSAAGA